jgi:hypothetical protein
MLLEGGPSAIRGVVPGLKSSAKRCEAATRPIQVPVPVPVAHSIYGIWSAMSGKDYEYVSSYSFY